MSIDKIRVYEIAKKVGKSSKEVIEKANQNGFEVKNHMSCVDSAKEKKILDLFGFNKTEDQKKFRAGGENKKFDRVDGDRKKIYKNRDKVGKNFDSGNLDRNKKWDKNKNNVERNDWNNDENSKNANKYDRNRKNFYKNRIDNANDYSQNQANRFNKNYYRRDRNNGYNNSDKSGEQASRNENDFYQRRKNINNNWNQSQNNPGQNQNRFTRSKNNFSQRDERDKNISNVSNESQNRQGNSQNKIGYNRNKNDFYESRRNNINYSRRNQDDGSGDNSRLNRNRNNFDKNNNETRNFAKGDNDFKNKNARQKDFDKNNFRNKNYYNNNSVAQNQNFGLKKSEEIKKSQSLYSKADVARKNFKDLDFESPINLEKQAKKSKKEIDNSKKYKRETKKENIQESLIYDLDKIKNKTHKNKKNIKRQNQDEFVETEVTFVKVPDNIVLKELADLTKKPVAEFIKILMEEGLMVNQNQVINFDLATKILSKFNVATEMLKDKNDLKIKNQSNENEKRDNDLNLQPRPPVVVVMGHVDHGKTSLLDAIRNTDVISTEAGGITQHIGAYTVLINDKNITFLDTPGHEAFTAMRMRGAQATDVAILVVAADDGIMPQTIEAINHAKAAGVEIIVAINKIDKPGADIERVKQELTEYDLLCEEWGGQTICVPVSAKNKIGIENLLEMVILVAEMKELKANPNQKASGIVIEAKLDKGRGPIATILVQNGTLKMGDSIVVGNSYGKIRAMINDKGKHVKSALPSMPVEILGLSSVPNSGEIFNVVENDKQAKQIAEANINDNKRLFKSNLGNKVSLDDLFSQIKKGNVKYLAIIIKADVRGSAEAIKLSLERLSNQEVKIKVIHSGVGAINESDVMLASASNAIVIGFNVRPENTAKNIADTEKVDIRLYKIIYDAIEDIKSAMQGLLEPVYEEKVIGHAEVRKLFKISGIGTVAGCYVTDGKILRNAKIRVVRDGISIYESEIASLRREKNDAKEVNENYECGILVEKFNDVKENDILEAYVMEEIKK